MILRVMPRYTGLWVLASFTLFHVTFSSWFAGQSLDRMPLVGFFQCLVENGSRRGTLTSRLVLPSVWS